MLVTAYPPFDTVFGQSTIELAIKDITLWNLLQLLADAYPSFRPELPAEPNDEALRARMLPIGDGHIYSVTDIIRADATIKIFPPVAGG